MVPTGCISIIYTGQYPHYAVWSWWPRVPWTHIVASLRLLRIKWAMLLGINRHLHFRYDLTISTQARFYSWSPRFHQDEADQFLHWNEGRLWRPPVNIAWPASSSNYIDPERNNYLIKFGWSPPKTQLAFLTLSSTFWSYWWIRPN